jgi:DNA-binding Lrp family transcriptional regulator
MADKHEAAELLREGLDPAAVARRMGLSLQTVVEYLRTLVGEGVIRRSDIYFSFAKDKRQLLQKALEARELRREVASSVFPHEGAEAEELEFFGSLRDRRVFAGDMYEYISDIEIALHDLVRNTLAAAFGAQEKDWWRAGVGQIIREKCSSRLELDNDPDTSRFSYTDLIDLSKIISKNRPLFLRVLPPKYASSFKALEHDLTELNALRNSVMHPVKRRRWSEDDFLFVRLLRNRFQETRPTNPTP